MPRNSPMLVHGTYLKKRKKPVFTRWFGRPHTRWGLFFWILRWAVSLILAGAFYRIGDFAIGKLLPKEKSVKETHIIVRATFSDFVYWKKVGGWVNDLIISPEGRLSLNSEAYKRSNNQKLKNTDPQGYIQVPVSFPRGRFFACTKVRSHTNAINLSTRLDQGFLLINGDGDNQHVAMKVITQKNPNGIYWAPDNPDEHVDSKGRYKLERPFPIGNDFNICLIVNAPPGEKTTSVKAEYLVVDDNGNPIDLGPMPRWTITEKTLINGALTMSLGLIDSCLAHPEVELRGFCAIEIKSKSGVPSEIERQECRYP
jgi:hypothetical protein